jgi:hypothetical protein
MISTAAWAAVHPAGRGNSQIFPTRSVTLHLHLRKAAEPADLVYFFGVFQHQNAVGEGHKGHALLMF